MSDKKFRFWLPLSEIKKSKDKDGKTVMKLGGIASTIRRDTDGESLDPANFVTDYLEEKGVVNWNHSKSPDAVIGEPVKVEKRKEGLYVESLLYPDNALAKSVYELAEILKKNSKTRRLGYSVEGKALERDPLDETKITKAMITNIALTISPKNPDSIVDIIKGNFHELNENDSLNKSVDDLIGEIDDIIKSEKEGFDAANGGGQHILDITKPDGTHVQIDSNWNIKVKKSINTTDENKLIKEDVDGNLKELKKAEAIDIILKSNYNSNSVISIEKALEIYQKIKKSAMSKNKKITDDLLEKSLSDLGVIEKGMKKEDDYDDMKKGDDDEEDEDDEMDDANDDVEKGEDDEEMYDDDEDEDEEEEEKPAKKEKKEIKKSEVITKPKIEKSVSTTAKKETMPNEKANGSETGNKSGNSTDKLQKSLAQDSIRNRQSFKALGTLIKGMFDELTEIKTELSNVNDELAITKTELIKANDSIEELSTQPANTRKSQVKPAERTFNKGITGNDVDGGAALNTKPTLSVSKNKNRVVAILDDMTFSKGFNAEIGKALTSFEATGNLNENIRQMIELEKGISLTK